MKKNEEKQIKNIFKLCMEKILLFFFVFVLTINFNEFIVRKNDKRLKDFSQ